MPAEVFVFLGRNEEAIVDILYAVKEQNSTLSAIYHGSRYM